MKPDGIVLRLRTLTTSLGTIAGADSLARAEDRTIKVPQAWVVPTGGSAEANDGGHDINQVLTESFSVILARNTTADYEGVTEFNVLDDLRQEIFDAILGWRLPGAEDPISFVGEGLLASDKARFFYEYQFKYTTRIVKAWDSGVTNEFLTIYGVDDLVVNGDFSVGTGWTLGTGWAIAGGVATHAAGEASSISQPIALTAGRTYTVKLTVSGLTAGSLTPVLGGTAGAAITADGEYEVTLVAGTLDSLIALAASAPFDGSIDLVGVKSGFGIQGEADAEFIVDLRS